jgi:hypothetical protein
MAQKIDPKLAQDIEDDMAEQDGKPKAEIKSEKQSVAGEECPDCANSLIGSGLLDANTICPTCQGTGKVAVLK